MVRFYGLCEQGEGDGKKGRSFVGKTIKVESGRQSFHVTEWELRYVDYLKSLGHEVELVPLGHHQNILLAKERGGYPKFGKCSEWDAWQDKVLIEATGGYGECGDWREVRYNKENMISLPFVMFGKRVYDEIKRRKQDFLDFKAKVVKMITLGLEE